MIAFIIARLLQAIPVLLVVGFISFAMFQFVGDPLVALLGQNFTAEEAEAMRHTLGMDQPFLVQYVNFLGRVLHAVGLSQAKSVNGFRKFGTILSAAVGVAVGVGLILIGIAAL